MPNRQLLVNSAGSDARSERKIPTLALLVPGSFNSVGKNARNPRIESCIWRFELKVLDKALYK